MAPQVAAGFAFAALALAQLTRPQNSRLHWIAPLATGAVFLIALVSFFGRLLRLDIIYDWHYATRIAPHTAVGLLLLSLGLAQIAYRRSFNKTDDVSNDSRRILAVSTAAMLAITITCAAVCFAVVVRHSHDLQQADPGSRAAQPGRAHQHRDRRPTPGKRARGVEPVVGSDHRAQLAAGQRRSSCARACRTGPSIGCR